MEKSTNKSVAKSKVVKAKEELKITKEAEVKAVAPKKEVVKKAPAKKTPAKKAPIKESMTIEFSGKAYTQDDLVKIAKDVWRYDLKKKVGDFKEVELFVKPEENLVYYVINRKEAGSFII